MAKPSHRPDRGSSRVPDAVNPNEPHEAPLRALVKQAMARSKVVPTIEPTRPRDRIDLEVCVRRGARWSLQAWPHTPPTGTSASSPWKAVLTPINVALWPLSVDGLLLLATVGLVKPAVPADVGRGVVGLPGLHRGLAGREHRRRPDLGVATDAGRRLALGGAVAGRRAAGANGSARRWSSTCCRPADAALRRAHWRSVTGSAGPACRYWHRSRSRTGCPSAVLELAQGRPALNQPASPWHRAHPPPWPRRPATVRMSTPAVMSSVAE